MMELIETLNYWLALGTVGLQFATVYILVEHFFLKEKYLTQYIGRFGLWIVFVLTIISVLLTLVYSDVFGFIPCGLCWMQRVFLYPLPIITGIAIWKKDVGEGSMGAFYMMWLSGVGAVIALYQHYIQMGGSELVTCPTAGAGADCTRRILFEFGYITYPLMAATTFIFVITVLLVYRHARARFDTGF